MQKTLTCYSCGVCCLIVIQFEGALGVIAGARPLGWGRMGWGRVCLEKVDKRIQRRGSECPAATLSSSRSTTVRRWLINKSGSGLPLYLRLEQRGWAGGRTNRLPQKVCLERGKSRRRSRLFSGCCRCGRWNRGWTDESVHCCTADWPTLRGETAGARGAGRPGNDRDYAECPLCLWCPSAVMDVLCRRTKTCPLCSRPACGSPWGRRGSDFPLCSGSQNKISCLDNHSVTIFIEKSLERQIKTWGGLQLPFIKQLCIGFRPSRCLSQYLTVGKPKHFWHIWNTLEPQFHTFFRACLAAFSPFCCASRSVCTRVQRPMGIPGK